MFSRLTAATLKHPHGQLTLTSRCSGISPVHFRVKLLSNKTRRFYSSSPPTTTVTPKTTATSKTRWQRFAQVVRFIRIPVVVISVYTLGYQQGVMDCTKEPKTLERQLLQGILRSTGCRDPETHCHVVNENEIAWHSNARHEKVAAIGQKIVSQARIYVETQLHQARQNVKSKHLNATEEELYVAYTNDEKVDYWRQALVRIDGEDGEIQPWQYIFVDTKAPNAFVTEILPRRFFITSSMLDLATNPHELAVVMGHEMAHLVLGHVSNSNQMEFGLRTTEVLLLSLDPTAGLLSMGLIFLVRKLVAAAYSRENELQADELGLELAASACFDTELGSNIMEKMHNAQEKGRLAVSGVVSIGGLMDTHPPSLDRLRKMKELAKTVNREHYPECQKLSKRLYLALWGP